MVFLSLILVALSGITIPNFVDGVISSEPHVSEIEYSAKYRAFLEDLRYKNQELPLECRNDFCGEQKTNDRRKGVFEWKLTLVGQQYHAPCPYGPALVKGTGEKHGIRNCVLIKNKAMWEQPNYKGCQDPPTAVRLKELASMLKNLKRLNDRVKCLNFLQGALQEIRYLYGNNTHVPVLEDDVIYGGLLLEEYTKYMATLDRTVSIETLRNMMAIADRILGAPSASIVYSGKNKVQVVRALIGLAKLVEFQENTIENISMKQLAMQVKSITGEKAVHMSDSFQRSQNESSFLNADLPATGKLQSTFLILYDVHPFMPRSSLVDIKSNGMPILTRSKSLRNYTSLSGNVTGKLPRPRQPMLINVALPRGSEYLNGDVIMFHVKYYGSSRPTLSQIMVNVTTPCCQGSKRPASCGILTNPLLKLRSDQKALWSMCHGSYRNGRLVCQYGNTGLYGKFSRRSMRQHVRGYTVDRKFKSTLNIFLRFPYSAELYITGHVLRALSLVCLVFTILSYVVFRRTRKGRPTLILLNLCLSLIALLIILSVTELFVGSSAGCRWANGLRLYFILVSLMWNGTEAINMYLLLIKVLNSHISKFMLKAAVVCWGIPAIIGILTVSINKSAFNGEFINCKFQCRLVKNTLYFAFLLPMSIIVLHNIIIFVMVVRCLLHASAGLQTDQKRSKFVQLAGSATLLVLLGVPWVFSVFGTIDASKGKDLALLEGIFNVVFVVFVNIQGVFIFLFHCVRVKDIRNNWRTAVTSLVSTASTTTRGTTSTSVSLSERVGKNTTERSEAVGTKEPASPAENETLIDETKS